MQQPATPWYKVPAMWLVVSIPTLTVVGCLLTMYIAITNPDPVLQRTEGTENRERP